MSFPFTIIILTCISALFIFLKNVSFVYAKKLSRLQTDLSRYRCIINHTREGVSVRYANTGKVRGKNTLFQYFFFCNLLFRLFRLVHVFIIIIHTEKYSPKSYVVNFHTQMSSTQSEERTMVFTREKYDTSNKNGRR